MCQERGGLVDGRRVHCHSGRGRDKQKATLYLDESNRNGLIHNFFVIVSGPDLQSKAPDTADTAGPGANAGANQTQSCPRKYSNASMSRK